MTERGALHHDNSSNQGGIPTPPPSESPVVSEPVSSRQRIIKTLSGRGVSFHRQIPETSDAVVVPSLEIIDGADNQLFVRADTDGTTKEAEISLNDTQRTAAEVTFSIKLFDTLATDVREKLPWLASQERHTNAEGSTVSIKDLETRDLGAMLDAYKMVVGKNSEDKRKFEQNWGEHGYNYTLEDRVRHLLPKLTEDKEKIFSEAATWHADEEKTALKDAHTFASKIPKEQRQLLLEQSGITPEMVRTQLEKWGITAAAFVGSTALVDEIAFLTGTAALGVNALANNGIDKVDTGNMIALLGGTYLVWAHGIGKNIQQNWKLLESEGWSTNAPSKGLHDFAEGKGYKESTQKFLTGAGYVGTELAKEVPWWFGTGVAHYADFLTTKESLLFMAGANLGASLYEYGAAFGTKGYLRYKEKKASSRIRAKHRKVEK